MKILKEEFNFIIYRKFVVTIRYVQMENANKNNDRNIEWTASEWNET